MDNEFDVDLTEETDALQDVADDFSVEPGKLIQAAVRWLLDQDAYIIGGVLAAYDDGAQDDLEEPDDFTPDELAVTN